MKASCVKKRPKPILPKRQSLSLSVFYILAYREKERYRVQFKAVKIITYVAVP